MDQCGNEKWQGDEDVHLAAGLTCVDCHREGLEHNTIRGYEGEVNANEMAAKTSCKGCHLGDENGSRPEGGRLGAPVPMHKGIPTVHFERLACTACHSGPWPDDTTYRVKTSQAHGLGTRTVNKSPERAAARSVSRLCEADPGGWQRGERDARQDRAAQADLAGLLGYDKRPGRRAAA